MTRRSLEDIEAHADELADAFESYEREPEDENVALPPLMAVRLAAWRRSTAEEELGRTVRTARPSSVTSTPRRRAPRRSPSGSTGRRPRP
mgnify:FL=1